MNFQQVSNHITVFVLLFCNSVGAVDPVHLLEEIELEIAKVKEEACSRKEVLDKVEKWLAACEEESWLEEYNRVGQFFYFHKMYIILHYLDPRLNLLTFNTSRMTIVIMLEEVHILP